MNISRLIKNRSIKQKQEPSFVSYTRTLMFWQQRFNDHPKVEPVFIRKEEIKDRFYPFPQYNLEQELKKLCDSGKLKITTITKGERKIYSYCALQPGAINPHLIKPRGKELDLTTQKMMEYLSMTDITKDTPSSLYFDTFLNLKDKFIRLFFIVDNFSGRVHTPITSMKGEYRKNLLIQGSETASLDVVTMQPVLLGKLLKQFVGDNEYSRWIDSGEDIYVKLQEKAGLSTRDNAKKKFFQILFNVADNSLARMFGNADWIEWINEYKSRQEEANPHTIEKNHSNLAWLLQMTEVELMRKVWERLIEKDIPFLSVHDEIIVRVEQAEQAEEIFNRVLSENLTYFKLSTKNKRQPAIKNKELIKIPEPKKKLPEHPNQVEKSIELKSPETKTEMIQTEKQEQEQLPELKTIDFVIDYLNKKGCKTLMEGNCTGISADNWKSQNKMQYEN